MTDHLEANPWPGLDPEKELYPEPKTFDKWKESRSKSVRFHNALLDLKNEGCNDQEALQQLLYRLYRSEETWNPISKSDVQQAIEALRKAQRHLITLKRSEFFRHVIPKRAIADQLQCELTWVIERLGLALPKVTKKQQPRSDDAVAQLLTHVYDKTGKYHYHLVAPLLEAALDLSWSEERLRKQCERLRKKGLL